MLELCDLFLCDSTSIASINGEEYIQTVENPLPKWVYLINLQSITSSSERIGRNHDRSEFPRLETDQS
jgi:hypothetical protein